MDESRFTLFHSVGQRHVYRRRGDRFADACLNEQGRFFFSGGGGGGVLLWSREASRTG